MTQVRKSSARLIVRLVIAMCLLGMMPALTAHPKSAKAATPWDAGSPGPAGGTVFYVAASLFTSTGSICGQECIGLEYAPTGWNSGSDPEREWGGGANNVGSCSNKTISGAQGTSIGFGFANTAAIMVACPDVSGDNSAPAARAADIYAPSGRAADWFLPSKDELNELCKYANETGQAAGGGTVCSGGSLRDGFAVRYQSSSEVNAGQQRAQYFLGGMQYSNLKYTAAYVRPVRAFGSAEYVRPTVATNEATLVATSSATLNATVNANFVDTTVAFSYATTADLSGATVAVTGTPVTGATDKTSTAALTGLKPGTKYYYRASATNSIGTSTGDIKNFTTTGAPPTVATNEATLVATSSATLNATVNANLIDTTVAFSYATTADLSGATEAATGTSVTGSTDKTSTAALTGLKPATKYYYRASATNSAGTSTGEIKNFTTTGALPTVTTGSASSIKASSADLNAVVNANLLKTTVVFFYGLSADLTDGKSISTRDIEDLTKVIDISVKIEGLVKSKTYYYRVVATNELGTAKGDIKSFVTSRAQGVTINDGSEFTNTKNVTVSVVAPAGSVKVILSNDGGFGSSQTFDLVDASADIAWKLVASRDERLPKIVYAKWVSRFGTEGAAVLDDIILDTTIPVLSNVSAAANTAPANAVTVAAVKKPTGAKIIVKAKDTNSGVGTIEIKSKKNGKTTTVIYSKPTAASQTVSVKTTSKTLYVRVLVRAANASPWKTVRVK